MEIRIAYELQAVVGEWLKIDLDHPRIPVAVPGARPIQVDIVLPELNVVIEYDGNYWHADNADRDHEKNKQLVQAGWCVLRIREDLPAVSALDVVVARGASVFACSIAVLDRIVEDLGCDINGKSVANQSLILMREAVNRYRAERRAWGAEAADAFINVQLAPQ